MTSTSASPSLTASSARTSERWNRRLVALLVALIWPTQLLAVAGIVTANTTADIAQRFHTTQVAWFSLIVTMVSTLLIPFVIKAGDRYGRRRIMLAMIGLGVVGDIIAAMAGSFWLLLVGRGIAACYAPFAALSFPAVRDLFPARMVKQASAILGGSMGLVGVVGPLLAGRLIDAGGTGPRCGSSPGRPRWRSRWWPCWCPRPRGTTSRTASTGWADCCSAVA